ESLDPSADAASAPGTFAPRCADAAAHVTAALVLRGGTCKMALAWYNATMSGPPAASELYPIVPATVTMDMRCADPDFCPLATMGRGQAPQHGGEARSYDVDVCGDSRYGKGSIGFALVGGAQPCTATKYTQPAANPPCTACTQMAPWVTALIYKSTAT